MPEFTGNRLAATTSPYLQQHASNPVHWQPWDSQALAQARQEDRPILLSIGYSACHWCHVMAHESFEDPDTAALMNRLFVNIKVDREERPDLDKIYQTAHQILSQRPGGWPLTVFLTPDDHAPFFAGTYFPPQPRHGLPGFRQVLQQIRDFYDHRRDEIQQQNHRLLDYMQGLTPDGVTTGPLDDAPLQRAVEQLASAFDARDGGFGSAPKFPHPSDLELLLHRYAKGDSRAGHMALHTLRRMARGGINDHLGGGFCRYSVDGQWMIPHFEKMLYDNGPLLALYAEAWQATGEALFQETAESTAAWVMGEMQSPEGGFYSSLDADSEGQEGRYYVWQRESVKALLNEPEWRVFAPRFGLDRGANFEGQWHLHSFQEPASLARELNLGIEQVEALTASARDKLLAERARRVRPGLDDKILTSWNALMIRGLARAGRILARKDWLNAASRGADFLYQNLWKDGRLLATCKDGQAHLNAYLDDYANLIDALLELLQSHWDSRRLAWAGKLAEVLLEHYQDTSNGGFYFTAHDHEPLIHRPKPLSDDATPAGNAVAALALGRLGHLLGEARYLKAAEGVLKLAAPALEQLPQAHSMALIALEETLRPPTLVICRGQEGAMRPWREVARTGYAPHRLVFFIPDDAPDLPPLLASRKAADGVTAHLCSGTACQPPIRSLEAFKAALAATTVEG